MEIPETIANQINVIKARIDKGIASTNNDRTRYRRKAVRLYMSTSMLAALTTLILGLGFKTLQLGNLTLDLVMWSKRIGLFFSAFITVISAYMAFYNHKDLWVSNTMAGNKLQALKFDIEYTEQNPIRLTQEQLDKWKDSYQAIMDERNSNWSKFRGNKP